MANNSLGYDLTATTTAAPLGTIAAAIIGKGEFQNDGKDHQAQKYGRSNEEEMAFDHAGYGFLTAIGDLTASAIDATGVPVTDAVPDSVAAIRRDARKIRQKRRHSARTTPPAAGVSRPVTVCRQPA